MGDAIKLLVYDFAKCGYGAKQYVLERFVGFYMIVKPKVQAHGFVFRDGQQWYCFWC